MTKLNFKQKSKITLIQKIWTDLCSFLNYSIIIIKKNRNGEHIKFIQMKTFFDTFTFRSSLFTFPLYRIDSKSCSIALEE